MAGISEIQKDAPMKDEIIAWIRRGLGRPGKTQRGLAEAIGRANSAVSMLLQGERDVRVDELPAMAAYFGVPKPYIVFGDEEARPEAAGEPTGADTQTQAQAQPAAPASAEPEPEPAEIPVMERPKEERIAIGLAAISSNGHHGVPPGTIPQIDASVGMGHTPEGQTVVIPMGPGETMLAHPVRDVWVIPPAALRRFTRATLRDLHLVECEGDSMEPSFHSGDFVLVDTSRKVPSPPGVFALWDGHGMTLKKAELVLRSDPPMVRLIPENKDYQAYELPLDEVNFVGRVVARISGI